MKLHIPGIDCKARLDIKSPMKNVRVVSFPKFDDNIIGYCYIFKNNSAHVGECDFANNVSIPYQLEENTIVIFLFNKVVQNDYCTFTVTLEYDEP
jgi:hypothetical protein